MPSHTSNANPEKFDVLQERSGAHTSVCIRSFAARVIRANSVRVRLQINDRSAGGFIDRSLTCHDRNRWGSWHVVACTWCSPQAHETQVVSHGCTETHTPNTTHRIGEADSSAPPIRNTGQSVRSAARGRMQIKKGSCTIPVPTRVGVPGTVWRHALQSGGPIVSLAPHPSRVRGCPARVAHPMGGRLAGHPIHHRNSDVRRAPYCGFRGAASTTQTTRRGRRPTGHLPRGRLSNGKRG